MIKDGLCGFTSERCAFCFDFVGTVFLEVAGLASVADLAVLVLTGAGLAGELFSSSSDEEESESVSLLIALEEESEEKGRSDGRGAAT